MRILGIESSCDETAAAVVEDGEAVLSSVVASQMSTHGKYGGVVPELASREHLRAIVPMGSLALFSTDTGDAWVLDPEDHLAARLARDGDPEDVYFEETATRFAIRWKGEYRIDGNAFMYIDNDSGRIVTILGYPVRRIAEWGRSRNFKYVWLGLRA